LAASVAKRSRRAEAERRRREEGEIASYARTQGHGEKGELFYEKHSSKTLVVFRFIVLLLYITQFQPYLWMFLELYFLQFECALRL